MSKFRLIFGKKLLGFSQHLSLAQAETAANSLFKSLMSSLRSIGLRQAKILTSSAYRWHFDTCRTDGKSLTNRENSIGPNKDPCATPAVGISDNSS